MGANTLEKYRDIVLKAALEEKKFIRKEYSEVALSRRAMLKWMKGVSR